ncbi:hypothetical protein PR048_031382 [Dryococelus australis]|uniref:Uncharacterized protein n=1 Tax=Dryococelus australis TaxID=614101 RepID=A0ABQ9G539_9NEOP|nr:hypothetical protein PR048_031382 [Dryococelus australis]
MERRRNERTGGNGRSTRKPADQIGIARHDSHLRKFGVSSPGIEPGSPWWEASGLTAQPPWSPEQKTLRGGRGRKSTAPSSSEQRQLTVRTRPSDPPPAACKRIARRRLRERLLGGLIIRGFDKTNVNSPQGSGYPRDSSPIKYERFSPYRGRLAAPKSLVLAFVSRRHVYFVAAVSGRYRGPWETFPPSICNAARTQWCVRERGGPINWR